MDLAQQMNATAAHVARDVDEFKLAGLTAAPCKLVNVPRVAESPVAFECKLTQIVQLQGADGKKAQAWVTFGEVVAVHIDKALIKDGVYQTGLAHPIVRAGRRATISRSSRKTCSRWSGRIDRTGHQELRTVQILIQRSFRRLPMIRLFAAHDRCSPASPRPASAGPDAAAINNAEFKGKAPAEDRIHPAVVKAQVLLDRASFSPGEIDGKLGENAEKALQGVFRSPRGSRQQATADFGSLDCACLPSARIR